MLQAKLPGYVGSMMSNGSLLRAASCALGTFSQGSITDLASWNASIAPARQLSSLLQPQQSVHANSIADGRSAASSAAAANFTSCALTSPAICRGFAAAAAPDAQAAEIFDRDLKARHRDRAARLQSPQDPVLEAVAEDLVDRLDDCKRKFPVAAVINGAGENIVRRLAGGRGGVQEVLLLDTSADMLERARRLEAEARAEGLDLPKVRYIQADEELLPLAEQSVDLIICPLGLHWINDLPGALTACRRALKPDGLLLGALLGGDSLQELRIACALAEQELEGGVSPRISPLAMVRDAGNLLTRAGLSIPAVDVDDITMCYSHPRRLVAHLRAMGESNAVRRRRPTLSRATAQLTADKYVEMFGGDDGTVPATFQIISDDIRVYRQVIYLAGWAPHSSQQRAARRGSASASFQDIEDALKQKEAAGQIKV